ncbi:hypothetical protein BTA51_14775 [Hahella sp. CCB-MM4]|uniref:efflux RND transporter periplasmic adaptor subunit n=1 Tax=Hahella sp. (strain CCB-MM4) TaxID=1926491 RepID=UPI000B9BA678|nr:efflux RND transporter periplasmic adaptor subunit [Hahella sp. CCB-MM4]OZG72781.1 hypothetical protein BTA51_14775 [Hahella sp. CCB-MM4]
MCNLKLPLLAILFLLPLITDATSAADALSVPGKIDSGIEVQTTPVELKPHQRQFRTYGEAEAFQTSTIASRIAATVTEVTAIFEPGVFVKKGALLLRLDKTDYQAQLSNALSTQAVAELELLQQQAASESAREDWFSNNSTPPPALAIQEPQLKAARARLESARDQVIRAKADLQSAEIRAPFSGWIIRRNTSEGDWVSMGSSLGYLVSADQVRIKLTLSQEHADLLGFTKLEQVNIALSSGRDHSRESAWNSKGLALAPIIDKESRQVNAYTVFHQPFKAQPPLRPGTFVSAQITFGDFLPLYAIPESSLTQRGTFFILEQGQLKEISAQINYRSHGYAFIPPPENILTGDTLQVVTQDIEQLWEGAPAYQGHSASLADVSGDQHE